MAETLEDRRSRRRLARPPEPGGDAGTGDGAGSVIQGYDASTRLGDVRREVGGTLEDGA